MRRSWVTALAVGLLACVLTAVAVLALDVQDSPPSATTALARADAAGQDDKGGHGPPPWANAGGRSAEQGKPADDWKDAWQARTPAQKSRKMQSLARAHEDGMRRWVRCDRAADKDVEERRDCEKPLPPGLAKKQP